jgi:hypothetical protein
VDDLHDPVHPDDHHRGDSEHDRRRELQTGRLLKSNVAAFLDFDTTSKPLLAILSSVDVFDIWGTS